MPSKKVKKNLQKVDVLGTYYIFDGEGQALRASLSYQDETHSVSIAYRDPAMSIITDDGNGVTISETDVQGKTSTVTLNYGVVADLLSALKILSHHTSNRYDYGQPIIKGKEI